MKPLELYVAAEFTRDTVRILERRIAYRRWWQWRKPKSWLEDVVLAETAFGTRGGDVAGLRPIRGGYEAYVNDEPVLTYRGPSVRGAGAAS